MTTIFCQKMDILVGKPEEKRPLKMLRHKLKDNIRMDLKEIGWKGGDQTHLAQGGGQWWTLVNMVMNLWLPVKVENFLTH
jgi:hypothetical protein